MELKEINLDNLPKVVASMFWHIQDKDNAYDLFCINGKLEMLRVFRVTEKALNDFIHTEKTNGGEREVLSSLIGDWTDFTTKADRMTDYPNNEGKILVRFDSKDKKEMTLNVPTISHTVFKEY